MKLGVFVFKLEEEVKPSPATSSTLRCLQAAVFCVLRLVWVAGWLWRFHKQLSFRLAQCFRILLCLIGMWKFLKLHKTA
jgi:hypothetical protein